MWFLLLSLLIMVYYIHGFGTVKPILPSWNKSHLRCVCVCLNANFNQNILEFAYKQMDVTHSIKQWRVCALLPTNTMKSGLSFSWFQFFILFVFLGLHLRHMEVLKLRVESELQLPAHTTATATWI